MEMNTTATRTRGKEAPDQSVNDISEPTQPPSPRLGVKRTQLQKARRNSTRKTNQRPTDTQGPIQKAHKQTHNDTTTNQERASRPTG
jgi:hypothetical protein